MNMHKTFASTAVCLLLLTHAALAQPQRPPIADPAYGFLVEGRVLLANGRAAAGVVIRRDEVASFVAESQTTDAEGHFRFQGRGLGWGPGTPWNMTLSRPGCADVHRTITLRAGPIDGRAQNEARDVELRVPRCDAHAHAPAAD